MQSTRLNWCPSDKLIIGMLHSPPLPGSPRCADSIAQITAHVLRDAERLLEGGLGVLMLENLGDSPYFPGRVPDHTIAHMSVLATAVRQRFDVPLGINVLRNDGRAALAIAAAAGGLFVRVNVLCSARLCDQGLIEANAHDVLRTRRTLAAENIAILADVDVKHSVPLVPRSLQHEIDDVLYRGGADAIIVSGAATGDRTAADDLSQAVAAAAAADVLVGSGVTADNVADYLKLAGGVIVGTGLKQDGIVTNPVDRQRVEDLVAAVHTAT